MPDLLIPDVDPQLVERIKRISLARGWTQGQTLVALLESGLFHGERVGESGFANPEQSALADAIAALQSLP
jgi:hypothetical protein